MAGVVLEQRGHQLVARHCEEDNTHWLGCTTCGVWYPYRLLGQWDYMSRVWAAAHIAGRTEGTDSVPELAPRVTDVEAGSESPSERLEEV